jgi:hypothetical protein
MTDLNARSCRTVLLASAVLFFILVIITARPFAVSISRTLDSTTNPQKGQSLSVSLLDTKSCAASSQTAISSEATTTKVIQPEGSPVPSPDTNNTHGWEFTSTRDGNNYGLSELQCTSAFEPLFQELDRAIAYRERVGPLTTNDIDIGWAKDGVVRAMIYDHQVRYRKAHR